MALDPNDWANCIDYVIDHTLVDEALSNFPIPIKLSASCGQGSDDATDIFDQLGANSKKIAVTDSSYNQLYVEIDLWDNGNEKAYLHVKGTSISNSADTTFYIFYDAEQNDNTTYIGDTGDAAAKSVWDSNFEGVWHKAQSPGGAGSVKDSTSNTNNGTPEGSMGAGDWVAGQFGKAYDYDGVNDGVSFGDIDLPNSFTVELLLKGNDNSIYRYPLSKRGAANNFMMQTDTSGLARCGIYDGTFAPVAQSTTDVLDNTWRYCVGVRDQSDDTVEIFVDGSSEHSVEDTTTGAIVNNNAIYAGLRNDSKLANMFLGQIGEIRLSNIARSAAWIKATYHGLFDSLATVSLNLSIAADPIEVTVSITGSSVAGVLVSADSVDILTALTGTSSMGETWSVDSIDVLISIDQAAQIFLGESVFKQDPWVKDSIHANKESEEDDPTGAVGMWGFIKSDPWKDNMGLGAWNFTKQPDKKAYNEGDEISTSLTPVFNIDFTGVPITSTHKPCGYWHSTPADELGTGGDPPSIYMAKCDDSNMEWDYDTSAETIGRNDGVLIAITDDGISGAPYVWELDYQSIENGFSLHYSKTTAPYNFLHTDDAACGLCNITVTGCDGLGTYTIGYVRCTEESSWSGDYETLCGQVWDPSPISSCNIAILNKTQYTAICDCHPVEICPACADQQFCIPSYSLCGEEYAGYGCYGGCVPCNFGYPSGTCTIGIVTVRAAEWVCE